MVSPIAAKHLLDNTIFIRYGTYCRIVAMQYVVTHLQLPHNSAFPLVCFQKANSYSLKNIVSLAEVQGGAYIRKLVNDLGKELGVGAHMLELRRVRTGIFKKDSIVNLYDFEKAVAAYKDGKDKLLREIIIPGEIVSELHPVVEIKKDGLQEKIKDIEGD